jgi:hypothetical protein
MITFKVLVRPKLRTWAPVFGNGCASRKSRELLGFTGSKLETNQTDAIGSIRLTGHIEDVFVESFYEVKGCVEGLDA